MINCLESPRNRQVVDTNESNDPLFKNMFAFYLRVNTKSIPRLFAFCIKGTAPTFVVGC